MKIYHSITELIGNTPLLALEHFTQAQGLQATILAKLERANPAGSAKDRVGLAMILDAEARGTLKPGGTIIEPTSGNTGIGLAAVAAARGYRVVLTMPDTMSMERRAVLAAYGAELVLTDGKLGMQGAIARANALVDEIPGSILAGQFTNPANPKVHFETTGPEIWRDTDGTVDVLVAGVGTGGTLSGTGKFLKAQNPNIHVVAMEPSDSPVLAGGKAGPHKLQGIGAGFVPETLDTSVYDEVIGVDADEAFKVGRFLARHEGLLVGISSAAAVAAAAEIARRPAFFGKNIVVILPDTGERYLSTELFAEN